ncbi:hypothetical protein BU16DRAFT_525225 [Lophium mytilinum]|uniref:Uncharacterized protein n=1 Tax=Lophium mytilinum TaxID=390894 RepID=A0A6A6R011_9PEZI|nr:hypothetical protein BU16DRAFT_525225 [Lophium mytilinum]
MSDRMDIPIELPLQINHHALVRPEPIDAYHIWIDPSQFVAWHTSDVEKNRLLANHQIHAEAHPNLYGPNLYGENMFCYPFHIDRGKELACYMPPDNLCIERQDFGIQYGSRRMPNPELWSPILAKLTRLVIVEKQPLVQRRGDPNDPIEFKDEVRNWVW